MREYVVENLGTPNVVLVIDETGFLKQGKAYCGIARDIPQAEPWPHLACLKYRAGCLRPDWTEGAGAMTMLCDVSDIKGLFLPPANMDKNQKTLLRGGSCKGSSPIFRNGPIHVHATDLVELYSEFRR